MNVLEIAAVAVLVYAYADGFTLRFSRIGRHVVLGMVFCVGVAATVEALMKPSGQPEVAECAASGASE